MTRRDAAWAIARAAGAAGAQDFFSGWLRATGSRDQPEHNHAANSAAPPDPHDWTAYTPKFFTPRELRCLQAFTEILIPTDETPGAREAHVAPFIDFVVSAATEYAPEMQQHWRSAMSFLGSEKFAEMPSEERLAFIERISKAERDRSEHDKGYRTYALIKEMTVHAFYTSRAGLIGALEYKGLAYLTEFPGCTHPEHQRV